MKKLIIVLTVVLVSLIASSYQSTKVYVCDSNTSVAYHSKRDCSGLSRCKHKIIYVTIDEAKKKGKRACKICY